MDKAMSTEPKAIMHSQDSMCPRPPGRRIRHRRPDGEAAETYMAKWIEESYIRTLGPPLDRMADKSSGRIVPG